MFEEWLPFTDCFADHIDSIHIVVQLEVAARIVARPGRRDYGYLSVASQFYTNPEIVLRIPPGAFRPPPRVASALLRMTLPGGRLGDWQFGPVGRLPRRLRRLRRAADGVWLLRDGVVEV